MILEVLHCLRGRQNVGKNELPQQSVVVFDDVQHLRLERNRGALEPVGVSRAVEALVVRAQDCGHGGERLQRQKHALGVHSVALELGDLLVRHARDGRAHERFGQRELAEIAEQPREMHVAPLFGRKLERGRRGFGECGYVAHAHRVARAGLNQAREHLHGGIETVFDVLLGLRQEGRRPLELGRALGDLALERGVGRGQLFLVCCGDGAHRRRVGRAARNLSAEKGLR